MGLKFGLRLPVSGPLAGVESLVTVSEQAESLGYDSVWVHDHVYWTKQNHQIHVASGSVEAVREDQDPNVYECLTTLSYLAGRTSKIKLGVSILMLPTRNPIMVAKEASTIDALSRGRLILGVGIGASSFRDQFDLFGVPFRERGRILDEYIAAIRELWGSQRSNFAGRYIQFSNLEIFPKPTGIPIWVAGESDAALERVARVGDGWLGAFLTPEEIGRGALKIREFCERIGRVHGEIEVATQLYSAIGETSVQARGIASRTLLSRISNVTLGPPRQLDEAFNRSLVGTVSDLTKRLEVYERTGLSHMQILFIYHSLPMLLEMMKVFASEIAPSFS